MSYPFYSALSSAGFFGLQKVGGRSRKVRCADQDSFLIEQADLVTNQVKMRLLCFPIYFFASSINKGPKKLTPLFANGYRVEYVGKPQAGRGSKTC